MNKIISNLEEHILRPLLGGLVIILISFLLCYLFQLVTSTQIEQELKLQEEYNVIYVGYNPNLEHLVQKRFCSGEARASGEQTGISFKNKEDYERFTAMLNEFIKKNWTSYQLP